MSDKSIQKKQYIVDCARRVFVEKGYKDVTMKDVVDECGISRGGLYLYFESTEELFLEVLRQDKEKDASDEDSSIGHKTNLEILLFFLKEQKKEFLKKKDSLAMATYEYYFQTRIGGGVSAVRNEFNTAFRTMEYLLTRGVEEGEFRCEDIEGTSRNFLFVLEGMRIYSQTMGLSSDMIDKEFAFLLSQIVVED